MKSCMLVHILYVTISLSIKGMLRARHGDIWELNLVFKRSLPTQNVGLHVGDAFFCVLCTSVIGVSQAAKILLGQTVR